MQRVLSLNSENDQDLRNVAITLSSKSSPHIGSYPGKAAGAVPVRMVDDNGNILGSGWRRGAAYLRAMHDRHGNPAVMLARV